MRVLWDSLIDRNNDPNLICISRGKWTDEEVDDTAGKGHGDLEQFKVILHPNNTYQIVVRGGRSVDEELHLPGHLRPVQMTIEGEAEGGEEGIKGSGCGWMQEFIQGRLPIPPKQHRDIHKVTSGEGVKVLDVRDEFITHGQTRGKDAKMCQQ